MFEGKKFLAIIPARGGSKRLPRKNILPLAGKPLIGWSIEAAQKSKYIDSIVVSSDDDEILQIAQKYHVGAYKRGEHLATDTATTVDVLLDVLEHTEKSYDYIMLLQPTSPLRNENHIDESIELLMKKNADAVISVCEMEHSPLWSNTLPDSLDMSNFIRYNIKDKRSQDLEKYYRLNGAIYLCKIDSFLKERNLFLDQNLFAYKMERDVSIDIDELLDFEIADLLLKKRS